MAGFDPRDRGEVGAAKGNAGYGGGGRRGGEGGTGFGGGIPDFSPRRTPNRTPSYQATPENIAKLVGRGIPGPGMIAGAGLDIAGGRPGFSGFTGNKMGPGDYDSKNFMGQQMFGAGLRGMQGGRPGAVYTPQYLRALLAQQQGRRQQPMPSAPKPMFTMGQAPGMNLQSGLLGYSMFRPGYDFITPPSR